MNRKSKIIVSVVGITIVALALLGLTYAYYLTRIEGNTNTNSISVTTADLKLTYNDGDGSIIGSNKTLVPDNDNPVGTKVFTVTNDGNGIIEDYAVIIENFAVKYHSGANAGVVTDLVNGEDGNPDMKLVITCKSYKNYGKSGQDEVGTCDGMDGFLPEKSDILLMNDIDKEITHEYTAVLTYLEDGTNQSDDMNKTIEGRFNIIDTKNTIDITGTVETYNPGDTVTIHSEPKESVIYTDGTYKFMGVKPDVHTIKVNGVEKGKVSIKGGTEADTTGTTINNGAEIPEVTITDESRTLTINLTNNVTNKIQVGTMTSLEKGTKLADAIISNASKVSKSDSQTYGYAILGETDTVPAQAMSFETEAVLSTTEDDYTASTGKPSYYFRGNVKNNYVNFAGMCWRIVRIEGDGSTKLILEDKSVECDDAAFIGDWEIGNGTYGYDADDYGNYVFNYLNPENTGMSLAFKNYQTTLAKKINPSILEGLEEGHEPAIEQVNATLVSKLKVGYWCLDDSAYSDNMGINRITDLTPYYSNQNRVYNGAYTRIYGNKTPTLKCDGTIMNDFNDNGESSTPMYVATLTADEIVFAGAGLNYTDRNYNYYLMNEYSSTTLGEDGYVLNPGFDWWALSPSEFFGSGYNVFILNSMGGSLNTDILGIGRDSFRPSIILKSATTIVEGGDGTINNPYVID